MTTDIIPTDTRQSCPACRGTPGLAKLCTICHGRGDVFFRDFGNGHIEIHPVLSNNEIDETEFVSVEERLRAVRGSERSREGGCAVCGERITHTEKCATFARRAQARTVESGNVLGDLPEDAQQKGTRALRIDANGGVTAGPPDSGGTTATTPPRPRETLSQVWAKFEAMILDPIEAGQDQRREMRRAFYAGADAFNVLLAVNLDKGNTITADDDAYMAQLYNEIVEFNAKIQRGDA